MEIEKLWYFVGFDIVFIYLLIYQYERIKKISRYVLKNYLFNNLRALRDVLVSLLSSGVFYLITGHAITLYILLALLGSFYGIIILDKKIYKGK